jgi:hypothetical protein
MWAVLGFMRSSGGGDQYGPRVRISKQRPEFFFPRGGLWIQPQPVVVATGSRPEVSPRNPFLDLQFLFDRIIFLLLASTSN